MANHSPKMAISFSIHSIDDDLPTVSAWQKTVLLQLFQLVTLDLPFSRDDFQIFSEFLKLFVDLLQVPGNSEHRSDTMASQTNLKTRPNHIVMRGRNQ
jgi:hypothetical protein